MERFTSMPNPFYYLIHESNIQWIKVEDACWGETLKDSKFFKGQSDNHKKHSSSTSRVELTENKTRRNWNLREPTKKNYKMVIPKKNTCLALATTGLLSPRKTSQQPLLCPISFSLSLCSSPPPPEKPPLQISPPFLFLFPLFFFSFSSKPSPYPHPICRPRTAHFRGVRKIAKRIIIKKLSAPRGGGSTILYQLYTNVLILGWIM